jgi:phosphatidylglycerophosphate synthase
MSIASGEGGATAPGRPREIETASNLYLVHPASRALVNLLVRTPITPNQVSMSSVVAAGAAALAFVKLANPWSAILGLAGQFVWHVLDGADGDLARRTGRASPVGELVDGVCDHISQALIYVAFGVILQASLGAWAWMAAAGAGLSHFLQANAYETGRKTYRRWVYGATWMRQTGSGVSGPGAALGGLYLTVSNLLSPGESAVERAMDERIAAGEASAGRARALYRERLAPLVKRSGLLGANMRSLAAASSILVGHPLWFFLFELTVLNLALVVFTLLRARANAGVAGRLEAAA